MSNDQWTCAPFIGPPKVAHLLPRRRSLLYTRRRLLRRRLIQWHQDLECQMYSLITPWRHATPGGLSVLAELDIKFKGLV